MPVRGALLIILVAAIFGGAYHNTLADALKDFFSLMQEDEDFKEDNENE